LQICSISTNMCRKFAKISFCAVRVFIGYFCCCLFFANSFNLLILLKNKMLENDIKRVTNSTKKYFLNLPHNPKVVGSNPTPATKWNSVEPPVQTRASTEFFDVFINRHCFIDLSHKRYNNI